MYYTLRMSMGKRKRDRRGPASHPVYTRLNQLLREHGFDNFVEAQCAMFYAETMGRPSLPPGIYFRLLLIGYFEGIDSERGIAWRAADGRFRRVHVRGHENVLKRLLVHAGAFNLGLWSGFSSASARHAAYRAVW